MIAILGSMMMEVVSTVNLVTIPVQLVSVEILLTNVLLVAAQIIDKTKQEPISDVRAK